MSCASGSTSMDDSATVTSLRELRAAAMLPLRRAFIGMAAICFSLLLEASDLESSSAMRERGGAILWIFYHLSRWLHERMAKVL